MQGACGRGHNFLFRDQPEADRILANGCPQCAQEQQQRQGDWAFLGPLVKAAVLEALAEFKAKEEA